MTYGGASHGVGLLRVRVLDAVLVLWVLGWIAVAVLIGVEVRDLGQLSTTLHDAGVALAQTASGIKRLGQLPLVGGTLGKLADEINATAKNAEVNANTSRVSVDHLSYLLAVTVAVVPSAPVLAVYAPFRFSRLREGRAIQSALRSGGDPLEVNRYLAHRALVNLPYRRLSELSADPWADVAEGRYDRLAAAELKRLGFAIPARHTIPDE